MRRLGVTAALVLFALAGPVAAATIVGKPGTATIVGTAKADRIDSADGKKQLVRCGAGRDLALVDELDRTSGCETVVRRVASDTTKGASGQHRTLLEPQLASSGSTVVGVYQSGRHELAGADAIGYATSHDAGASWKTGLLPGVTALSPQPGRWESASNASVAWDAKHGRWLVESAVLTDTEGGVLVSASTDGLAWQAPVTVFDLPRTGPTDAAFDKPWIVCDDSATSSRYGRCYVVVALAVTLPSAHLAVWSSDDGGATWQASPATLPAGNGAQPVVRPDGTLVVVYTDLTSPSYVESVRSTDGGGSFAAPVRLAQTELGEHTPDGLRAPLFPSVAVAPDGSVVATWPDCSATSNCLKSDLVLARSVDGSSWSTPARLPLGASGDDLSPGLAVDSASGRLAVAYLVSEVSRCCRLDVRVAVQNAGGAWTIVQANVRAMQSSWTASSPGAFLGDYLSVTWSGGHPVALLPIAFPRSAGSRRQDLFAFRG
ncbi:MAG TPA: sialidase family protein [Gaiellaceae bacterium]|nr:sialidase family protein [Gaiellaceae bacterium]